TEGGTKVIHFHHGSVDYSQDPCFITGSGPQEFRVIPEWEAQPWWPQWLRDRLGPDYLENVVLASQHDATDADMVHFGRLHSLEWLVVRGEGQPLKLTDAGLVHLQRLTKLKRLELISEEGNATSITAAGLASLRKLTQLDVLTLRG